MRDDLAIGIALKRATGIAQFGAQLLVILDDAIVHQRDLFGSMRMRVLCRWRPMRGPARMRDADLAGRGLLHQFGDQIVELAFGAAADQRAVIERADPGTVVTAIFHPAEAVDQPIRYRFLADDTDDAAHLL